MRAGPARRSRLVLACATVILGVAGVYAGLVVAQSDDGDSESGPLADVRHANPPRKAPLQEVARGATRDGRPYVLKVSQAAERTCLAVEYPDQGSDAPKAVVSLRGSEICVDPSQRPVTASMEQLFVDPETGQVTDVPQRFAYGFTAEDSIGVEVRGPDGRAQSLRVTDAPGAIKVFAGSVTGYPAGSGSVTATDAQGRVTGEQGLRFAGPKTISDAELAERVSDQ